MTVSAHNSGRELAAVEMCPRVNITCKISAAPAGPTDTHKKSKRHEQKPYCRSPEPPLSYVLLRALREKSALPLSVLLSVFLPPMHSLPSPNLKAPKERR